MLLMDAHLLLHLYLTNTSLHFMPSVIIQLGLERERLQIGYIFFPNIGTNVFKYFIKKNVLGEKRGIFKNEAPKCLYCFHFGVFSIQSVRICKKPS